MVPTIQRTVSLPLIRAGQEIDESVGKSLYIVPSHRILMTLKPGTSPRYHVYGRDVEYFLGIDLVICTGNYRQSHGKLGVRVCVLPSVERRNTLEKELEVLECSSPSLLLRISNPIDPLALFSCWLLFPHSSYPHL